MRFLPIFFILLFAQPSFAQLGDMLQNRIKKRAMQKAEQRVQQEINEAVDKKVDEALDEVFEDKSEEKHEGRTDEERQQAVLESIYGSSDDEPVNFTPLDVTGAMTMTMNNYKNGKLEKNNPMTIKMSFDRSKVGMEMSNDGKIFSKMIHDLERGKMIVISENDGETQAMEMSSKMFMRGAKGKKVDDYMEGMDIKKTGNRKTIQGYACEEYIITSEDAVTNSWVTQDAPISSEDMANIFAKGMNMGQMMEGQQAYKDFTGLAIESTTILKDGKNRIEMTISNISDKVDASILDVSKYEIMKMPGF